jgi:hypothetical protein
MFESKINRGKANGYAPLDGSGKVPLDKLPPIQSLIDTGSFATTSSLQTIINVTGSFATTGSNTFNGNQTINGSLILDNGAVIKDNVNNSISFGYQSAETNQGTQSVAIGNGAGNYNQSHGTVAVGANAGALNQEQGTVALGSLAGANTQRQYSIAVGTQAGGTNQGQYSIALGYWAGRTNQASHSIVINATGNDLDNTISSSLKIAPIRNVTGSSGILQYDDTTKEVSYSNDISNFVDNLATTGSNTFVGNQIISGSLNIATNGGDEGGEILLGRAITNTTLTGSGVVMDVYRDSVRIFEQSGSSRGAFLDITKQSNSVGSQIVTSPNIFSIQTITSASYASLTPVSGTLYVIID